MRLAFLFPAALLFTLGGTSHAQLPPPVRIIGVAKPARDVFDSLAMMSWARRVETAGCLTRYAIAHDTLLIADVGPATYLRAELMAIITADSTGICPPGVPSVHTHILGPSLPAPSPTDSASARRAGVWSLVLAVDSVRWRIVLYGGVPSPPPR